MPGAFADDRTCMVSSKLPLFVLSLRMLVAIEQATIQTESICCSLSRACAVSPMHVTVEGSEVSVKMRQAEVREISALDVHCVAVEEGYHRGVLYTLTQSLIAPIRTQYIPL